MYVHVHVVVVDGSGGNGSGGTAAGGSGASGAAPVVAVIHEAGLVVGVTR